MFISKEEAERRLNSPRNLVSALASSRPVPSATIKQIDHSRTRAVHSLTEEKRTEIAKTVFENPGLRHEDVGLMFGISKRTVSTAKTGKVGGRPATEERKLIRQEMLNSAKDSALDKLMQALGLIDGEKLASLENAKDIGRFSKDMASVYNSLTAQTQASGAQVNLIVYAPKSKNEDNFKIVDV